MDGSGVRLTIFLGQLFDVVLLAESNMGVGEGDFYADHKLRGPKVRHFVDGREMFRKIMEKTLGGSRMEHVIYNDGDDGEILAIMLKPYAWVRF